MERKLLPLPALSLGGSTGILQITQRLGVFIGSLLHYYSYLSYSIRLLGTPFAIEWPTGNMNQGTQLIMGAFRSGNNHLWNFEEGGFGL
jgi:hypothetical protein